VQPAVSEEALKQLKFAELLPPHLAELTLGARAADHDGAKSLLARAIVTL
jgi:ATP-dependent Lhr-like helicase